MSKYRCEFCGTNLRRERQTLRTMPTCKKCGRDQSWAGERTAVTPEAIAARKAKKRR